MERITTQWRPCKVIGVSFQVLGCLHDKKLVDKRVVNTMPLGTTRIEWRKAA